jgi:orotidine-5'-phosphate decarboxylase
MGTDTIEPFLSHPAGAAIVLCRTSNPGSAELQSRSVDGMALFEHVARTACETWSRMGDVSLVVGATWPAELARVRALTGDMTFLVPGVGAQGGDPAEVVRNGRNSIGTGLVVNSSRAILYASAVDPVAEAARVARETRDALNAAR